MDRPRHAIDASQAGGVWYELVRTTVAVVFATLVSMIGVRPIADWIAGPEPSALVGTALYVGTALVLFVAGLLLAELVEVGTPAT